MPPPSPKRLMSWYSIGASLTFLCLWLLPITWVGSTSRDVRWMPTYLKHVQRCACLFTREARSWKTYHVEVQTDQNPTWHELSPNGYFDMEIFGYRTRLHRILGYAYRGGASGRRRTNEIARFIATRHRENHPQGPRLTRMRFIRAQHPSVLLAKQKGKFVRPPLSQIPEKYRTPFGETAIRVEHVR